MYGKTVEGNNKVLTGFPANIHKLRTEMQTTKRGVGHYEGA